MPMPIASVTSRSPSSTAETSLDVWYDLFGEPTDVPVVLIAGLGTQGRRYTDDFCQGLADRYLHVIRMDNRDVGLSSRFSGLSDPAAYIESALAGNPVEAPYSLDDMAADVVGLLDALSIGAAHIVGTSMGGMIVQLAAINHPDRVLSVTSIMSNTGNDDFGQPTPEALEAIFATPPTERDAAIAHDVRIGEIWASPEYWKPEAQQAYLEECWDRTEGLDRNGGGRQAVAILSGSSREEALAELQAPTLVIHGDADVLVQPSGGERTAEVVPGANLLMIEGMGHDTPPELCAPIIEAIVLHVIASAQ